MKTYRLKGILDESLLNMPKLLRLWGQDVEIIIKKNLHRKKNNSDNNLKKAQDIMSKYIPKNTNLSDELISERRKEFESE
jgi:hypothetical protein